MSIPERIPISRIENYYTKNIGSFDDGKLFMGSVVAEFSKSMPAPLPSNWEEYKRWYAILHTFENDGTFVETKYWFADLSSEGESAVIERADKKLAEFMSELGSVKFRDIAIRLFSTTIDDLTFGLVAAADGSYVELLPEGFAFYEPWNGQFDS